jgi:hypothetical protein
MKLLSVLLIICFSTKLFSQDITKYNVICTSIALFKDGELKKSTTYSASREIIYSKDLEYIKISYPEENSSDFFTLGKIFDSDVEDGYSKIYQKSYLKNSSKEEAFIFYWKNNKLIKIQRCFTDIGTLFVTTFDIVNPN